MRQVVSIGDIDDNLSNAGMEFLLCPSFGLRRRTIWIVDSHRGNPKRVVMQADQKLKGHRRSGGVKSHTDFSRKFPTAKPPVLSNSRD